MNNRSFEKIGRGGNNSVYETKKNSENGLVLKFNFNFFDRFFSSVLGKVDTEKLAAIREMITQKNDRVLLALERIDDEVLTKKIINFYNNEENENIDDIMNYMKSYLFSTDRALSLYKKEINNEFDNYSNLVKFFKKDNLLGQKIFSLDSYNLKDELNLKISDVVMNDIISSKRSDDIKQEELDKIKSFIIEKNISVPVIVQEKFDFKGKEDVFEFNSSIPKYDTYKKTLEEDLAKEDYTNTINLLSRHLKSNDVYQLLEKDPSSKEAVCDFLKRVIEYTKNTHKFIDFFGGKNIFFYKEGGVYKYKLLDPIFDVLNYSKDLTFKNDNFQDFIKKNIRWIRHFYVYIKTINDLAEELDMEERLRPEDYFGTKINGVEEDINNFIK